MVLSVCNHTLLPTMPPSPTNTIPYLLHADVETFITFRSSTPMVLSVCDYVFLGRQLPNARSWACLVVLVLGSIGYVVRTET